ncbi:MAG: hypothetical protein JOY54_03510 [Acidobacteriaceae bacterium]|nr:hypothetical protein [Acidobacteriaceae bacterium]
MWLTPNARKLQARLTIACLMALGMAAPQGAALERYFASSWTHKDGLPSTLIQAITQTRDGYLWLGTSDGLVRFDGINFVHQKLFSTGDLILGAVTALCATKDGALWAGSASGVVVRMSGSALQKYRLRTEVEAIVQAPDGDVWVIAQNGLNRFGESRRGELFPAERIDAVHVVRVLASSTDVFPVGPKDVAPAPKGPATYARKIILGNRELFLNQADSTAWLAKRSFIGDPSLSAVVRDRRGYIWAGRSDSGLLTGSEGRENETELADERVESLFEDREGNIWVGTNYGLSRFRFGKIFPLTKRDGLSTDRVSALEATGSTVWVGTQNGLNRIDNMRVQCFFFDSDVLSVASVGNDRLWLGTTRGVFTVGNEHGIPKPQLITRTLTSVVEIEKGPAECVWLLDAQKGLYLWKNGVLLPLGDKLNTGAKTITAIRGQEDGALWMGFADGDLGVYKEDSFHELSTTAGFPAGTVHDIYVEQHWIWLATDAGLYRFDGKHFAVWNAEKGLPGDRVLWIQPEGKDTLWLGFSTGVAKVRRSDLFDGDHVSSHKLQCDFYDSGDGLFANPIRRSQSAAVVDSEGKLWFTTSAGVALIDSRRIEKNSVPPPVVIQRVIADSREAPIGSLLRFPPLTRNLEIDYAGLSLVAPRKVQFRYQLEGYDREWENAGPRRQAFYTNLPPGAYRFHVIAANNDGLWNEQGAALNFTILPAFYQTGLFKALCIGAAAAIAWGFYRLRLQQMQAALNARFEERLAERTRIAQDLHDELLQSAMGVSLQVELTDALLEESHTAKPHLQRALALARELMQKGREVLRDLREKERESADISRALSKAIEDVQGQAGPAARLIIEGHPRAVNPLVADELVQIGCQALANAFQHSTARRIGVFLIYSPAELCLDVEDNGRGIDPRIAETGKPGHYGLIGMRERAERIGGTLTITSRIGDGTKVKLVIPGKRAYKEVAS